MTSLLFFAVGSRGDVQPIIALSSHLITTGAVDDAHLFVTRDYADLPLKHSRVHVHTDPLNSMEAFYAASSSLRESSSTDDDIVATGRRTAGLVVRNCVTPLTTTLHKIASETQSAAIVSTTLGALSAKSVAQRCHIPAIVIHFQPNVPTSCFPFYLAGFQQALQAARDVRPVGRDGERYVERRENMESYDLFLEMFRESIDGVNTMNEEFGIPPMTDESLSTMFSGNDTNVRVVLSYPTALIPTPPTQSRSVLTVESLAEDYIPPNWDAEVACPSLHSYITSSDKKPICISVGSINVPPEDVARISSAILAGLRKAGVQRAVVLRGSGRSHLSRTHVCDADLARWAETHVYECEESVEFAWLFKHCAAVLSHGGAGTVAAALYAGVPVAIAPMMCDQFFWAETMEQYAIGAFVRPRLLECTAESVYRAISRIQGPDVVEKAKDYRKKRSEMVGGCEAVKQALERSFP